MKLPYRVGDSCALPLGDGRRTRARIVGHVHHLVDLAIEDASGRDVLVVRTTDRALVLQRWQRIARANAQVDTAVPRHPRIVGPAHAERLAARALGAAIPDERPLAVRMLHRHTDLGPLLGALSGDAMLVLSEPLAPAALALLRAWCEAHPSATIRLDGEGATQLADVASWPVSRVVLAGEVSLAGITAPRVRWLDLLVPLATAAVVDAFPELTSLRASALRAELDVAALARLHALRALDCSHVRLRGADALPRLRALRALRVASVEQPPSPEAIAALPLHALAIEAQGTLGDLRALARCAALQELELRELWQFAIEDVTFVHEMRALQRVEIDIGGRRKNVELYRRASWAYPWPFAYSR